MDKTSQNFNKLLQSFMNKWVAVSDDYGNVFASGDTLQSVLTEVRGRKDIKMFLVIPFDVAYSPHSFK